MTGPAGDSETETAAPPPVFLERQSYRRRRLMDAARLLPMLGALLFAVPLLWPGAEDASATAPVPMSFAIRYIFAVWAVLILASIWFGGLTRGWMRSDSPADIGEAPERGRG